MHFSQVTLMTLRHTSRPAPHFSSAALGVAAWLLAHAAPTAHAAQTAAAPPTIQTQPSTSVVGEATLVIGQAQLVGANGNTHAIERGTAVRVGDQVHTAVGGHVYLRFVDGANLSVRPMSRIHIESYSHNPQQPQLGAIKFKLEEGTARSITGAWGEAARERFRLNTPVAAIGVKGTDFTVRSDAQGTSATVYTGAIVVAPLTNSCAAAVGPCHTGLETQLSADMRGQMLQLADHRTTPLLVAAANFTRHNSTAAVTPAAPVPATNLAYAGNLADNHVDPHGAGPSSKTLDNEMRAATVAVLEVPTPPPAPPPPAWTEPPAPPPAELPPPTAALPDLPPMAIPDAPPTPVGPPSITQLSWARYPWTPGFSADQFVQAFADAAQAGLETVSANSGAYVLYRNANNSTTNRPTEAVVDLRLANATAHLLPIYNWKPAEAVAVTGGSLQIDFSRSLFQTALALQGNSIGSQSINASGTIAASGAMLGTQGDATVSGAITPDGTEAGYFFQKVLPEGALRGITLWGR